MEQLREGFRRFRATAWRELRERFATLATEGQSPAAMVICCSDSRIDPQLIFDTKPGEIFVVRNVANLVPPYAPNSDYHGTSAALEFAVRALRVEHVVVLGHSQCGGISALLRGIGNEDGFLGPWMQIAAAARDRALAASGGDLAAAQRICEHEGVKVSLENLMTFPWLRARVERRELRVHGCYFDLHAGDLVELGAVPAPAPFDPAPAAPNRS